MRINASFTLSALAAVAAAAPDIRRTDVAESTPFRLPPTSDSGVASSKGAIQTRSPRPREVNPTDLYKVYKDVRYGAKPARFRRAVRAAKFEPTPTEQNNQICPQAVPTWSPKHSRSVSVGNQTEDCLFLDVYATNNAFSRARAKEDGTANKRIQAEDGAPVVVWFHPGNFVSGSKNDIDAEGLIVEAAKSDRTNKGLVVVSFNYRLGMFGWMPVSNDSNVVPNVGLWDQRLALEWIRDHIAWYGGDPARVTVVGDQSGAASIMHHMTAFSGERNKPDFARAILNNPFWNSSPAEDASEQLLLTANRFQDRNMSRLADLGMLSAEDIQDVNEKVIQASPPGRHTFGPVLDKSIVSTHPIAVLRDDALTYQKRARWETTDREQIDPKTSRQRFARKDIPFIVGTTRFHPGMTSDELPEFDYVQMQDTRSVREQVIRTFPHMRDGSVMHLVKDLYPYQDSDQQKDRMTQLLQEGMMECNAYALSRAYPDQAYFYAVDNAFKATRTPAIQTRDGHQSTLTAEAARNSTNALARVAEPTCFLCKPGSALRKPLSQLRSGAEAPFPWMLNFILKGDPNDSKGLTMDWPMFRANGLGLAFQSRENSPSPKDEWFPSGEEKRCEWWMKLKERPNNERHGNYLFKRLVSVESGGHPSAGWTGRQGTMPVALVAALAATAMAMA